MIGLENAYKDYLGTFHSVLSMDRMFTIRSHTFDTHTDLVANHEAVKCVCFLARTMSKLMLWQTCEVVICVFCPTINPSEDTFADTSPKQKQIIAWRGSHIHCNLPSGVMTAPLADADNNRSSESCHLSLGISEAECLPQEHIESRA